MRIGNGDTLFVIGVRWEIYIEGDWLISQMTPFSF